MTTTTQPLKILIVADGNAHSIYGGAYADAFTAMGHKVDAFLWQSFFARAPYLLAPTGKLAKLKWAFQKAQNKFLLGPSVMALNHALIAQVKRTKPHLIFCYRPTHIWPSTLATLRRISSRSVLMGYNNDDPFSPAYPRTQWRHFMGGLRHYHHLFAYRPSNLTHYAQLGLFNTSLLRAAYLPHQNQPVKVPRQADISFIGHYEPDGRDDTILHLINSGINVALHGTLWEQSPHYATLCAHMGGPIQPCYGAAYNATLCSAPMALVFLSQLNRDSYTRRCLEIPAAKVLMVSQYTDDLAANLFTPNTEALYFQDKHELLTHVQTMLAQPKRMANIAAAGHTRLLADGHTPTHRCQHILTVYNQLKS